MQRYTPDDAAAVTAVIREAAAGGERLAVRGLGTRDGLGHPTQADAVLDLGRLNGILDYQPSELLLTAHPATPLAEVAAVLQAEGQMLAFEPCLEGSLGGALAINDSGPRRFRLGAARDHLLGFEAVTGRGEFFVAGGRVVKNVTGYDLSKLLCGSFGTLAVLTCVHVKVWPAPKATKTVMKHGQSPAQALATLTAALASPHDPTGAAFVDGSAAVRVEGPTSSVAHRAEALRAHLEADEVTDHDASLAFWAAIRDATAVNGMDEVWRVSVPPAEAATFIEATAPDRFILDQGGGRIWLGYTTAQDVRRHLVTGHATLIRASDARKAEVPVFQPAGEGVRTLESRIKAQFDPAGILEPGRRGPA
ncbi:MAG: FAD-binding protein [Myxococcota bacterium]